MDHVFACFLSDALTQFLAPSHQAMMDSLRVTLLKFYRAMPREAYEEARALEVVPPTANRMLAR
eukprot:4324167-Pleurochrysis_carterae.AAC.2